MIRRGIDQNGLKATVNNDAHKFLKGLNTSNLAKGVNLGLKQRMTKTGYDKRRKQGNVLPQRLASGSREIKLDIRLNSGVSRIHQKGV